MSRDSFLKTQILATVLIALMAICANQNLVLEPTVFLQPVLIAISLLAVAAFYQRRQVEQFSVPMVGLAFVTSYTSAYTMLMYAVCTYAPPLADWPLIQFDQRISVDLPSIVAWARSNPGIESGLRFAYDSLMLQTPLVIVVLGFTRQRIELEQFVLQFMIASLLTLAIFACRPAVGPFVVYGYDANPAQLRYLDHFQSLRNGEMTRITWQNAEGLITFPSFHTTWALLLTWPFRKNVKVFVPLAFWNLAVIAATQTEGWHYFADVVGGITVTAAAVSIAVGLKSWLYPANESERVADHQRQPAVP